MAVGAFEIASLGYRDSEIEKWSTVTVRDRFTGQFLSLYSGYSVCAMFLSGLEGFGFENVRITQVCI